MTLTAVKQLKTPDMSGFGQQALTWTMGVLTALALLISASLVTPAYARSAPASFADLIEKVSPAVVNISTSATVKGRRGPQGQMPPGFEEFFEFFDRRGGGSGGEPRKVQSLGSGFIIDPDGLVVTNNHVIDGADEITVKLPDGTELDAELIGKDPKTDIALLRVQPEKKLPYVSWGNSDRARVGDWVVAIGNPLGLGGTVTAGIVSARNRDINAGPYDDFIQTDAPINRGNSGGPLFDMDGRVIGVNTAIISPSGGSIGIGFAVPSQIAQNIVKQLSEHGETRRGWLGVKIQVVTEEVAESLDMPKDEGALVAAVDEKGPAKKGGIEAGDVILSFDGKRVKEMRELPRLVADTPVGKRVPVVVWRNGKRKTLMITIDRLDETSPELAENDTEEQDRYLDDFGLTLAPLNDDLRNRFKFDAEAEGVVIVDVDRRSQAAERGLRPGMLILRVGKDKQAVSHPDEVYDRIEKTKKQGRKTIILYVGRGGNDQRFVVLKLDDE